MKTQFTSSESQFFFHRYIVDSSQYTSNQKVSFQGQDQMNYSLNDFGNSKTSIHKCRMINPNQNNIEQWPMYLLKRVSYEVQKKSKKKKTYQIFDSNIKKLDQIKTQYLCYKILNQSHRVVNLVQIINQNPKNSYDQKFFYEFLKRKEDPTIRNVCFILELCNDQNLKDRIQNSKKPLTQNQIVIYCCQILQGLIQLKKKGILHRDLRACNIFLHNDQIKFGDFDSAFIYKQSQCKSIKNGIDINTTPQQIVELAALSDQQLQDIGNFKLFDLQSKCDIYFFGMIIFKMVFKRDYEKKFEGTDLDYLVRQKLKQGFQIPKLLKIMKLCLESNYQKRIDLVSLNQQFRQIEKHQYFANKQVQKVFLINQPMNLFSYNTLENTETMIQEEIQNFIHHTFTYSFGSVQFDFESDFLKSTLIRNTKLYLDAASQILAKNRFKTTNLWDKTQKSRELNDKFILQSQDFVYKINSRVYFYDKLYRLILKINTNQLSKRQHKQIVTTNKQNIERQLIFLLKFLFQILSRTPFKIDKHYEQKLSYQVRNLFKNLVKINKKAYFYNGRAKIFNSNDSQINKMVSQFYNAYYQDSQITSFEPIYHKINALIQNIDSYLKSLLRQTIVDLLRPYQVLRKSKSSNLKQILFIMIILEKQNLKTAKKNQLVLLLQIIQPIINFQVNLDRNQIQLFFESFKRLHSEEVQKAKQKQNIKSSMNLLLGISSNHLNCLQSFFSQANSARTKRQKQDEEKKQLNQKQQEENIIMFEQIENKQESKNVVQNQTKKEERLKIVVKDVEEFSDNFSNFVEQQKISQNGMIVS